MSLSHRHSRGGSCSPLECKRVRALAWAPQCPSHEDDEIAGAGNERRVVDWKLAGVTTNTGAILRDG